MDSATRLIVVRHGNTFNSGDVILRVGARTDIPLTSRGREQGREVAQRLVERGLRPDAYFYAPLQRTRETCEEIASAPGNVPGRVNSVREALGENLVLGSGFNAASVDFVLN